MVSKYSTTDVQSYNDIELILENESGEMHKMDTSNEGGKSLFICYVNFY